jgi:diguanylate cyclase (GGDEF)-like protein
MAILEDITERVQTETALHQANEELKIWIFEYGQRNRDITLLNQMSDMLQACLTIDEAYAGLARFGKLLFPRESGALFIFNGDKNLLETAATWGKKLTSARQFAPEDCWALRQSQEYLVTESQGNPLCPHMGSEVPGGYLCVPLAAHGETLGLLLVQGTPAKGDDLVEDGLSESKQRLAVTAAKQMALALANLNLRHSLFLQAIHDPLTGLYNRRYMEDTLEREIYRVQRKDAPLGLVMLDLDHFKRFNDTFGHEAGDTLLREVSHYLKHHIRQGDIACRYGGEEFLLILPEASLETTRQRAEKLRQGVQRLEVEYLGRSLGTITVSVGVAVFPEHGSSMDEVIRAADAALYRAKQEGRNRVVAAESPETPPQLKKLALVDQKK